MNYKNRIKSFYSLFVSKHFTYFFIGCYLVALGHDILKGAIVSNKYIFIFATILIIPMFYYLYDQTYKNYQKTAGELGNTVRDAIEKLDTCAQYFEEPYEGNDKYQGIIYQKVIEWIKEAEFSIRVLGLPVDRKNPHPAENHPSRMKYFEAIEQKVTTKIKEIEAGQTEKFKYVRIEQITEELESDETIPNCHSLTCKHCQNIFKIKSEYKGLTYASLDLDVLKVKTERISSFIIVDDRFGVFSIDGYDFERERKRYMIGALFFEDRKGININKLIDYFDGPLSRKADGCQKQCIFL